MSCNLTWMVSGSRVREVSGMKVTSSAARSAITPNTTSGTCAPYTRSSTMKGAIWQERSSLLLYSATVLSQCLTMGPTLAQKELLPRPAVLTTVGKTSAE